MYNLRSLRRSRSLTFLDLAALTGISARTIAEIEYGLRPLTPAERGALALVLGLRPHDFTGAHRRPGAAQTVALRPRLAGNSLAPALVVSALAATLAASVGAASQLNLPALPRLAAPRLPALTISRNVPSATEPSLAAPVLGAGTLAGLGIDPARDDAAQLLEQLLGELVAAASRARQPLSPPLLLAPTPPKTVAPPPAAPAFVLSEHGPLGCPVRPQTGRVVLTQGYGVGSHAPAEVWGAVDLAVDGDGDGHAEPGASWYAPVLASHDGVVRVTLNSYPAGNHVWVAEPGGVWRTGYAHLALVTVASGQFVRAGEQIGLLGDSGVTSGPHLDYQVWQNGVNLDPTELVGCQ